MKDMGSTYLKTEEYTDMALAGRGLKKWKNVR